MSLRKRSLTIALGAVLGIFQVLGTTTILCTLVAFLFRLNFPSIQIVNYVVYPLQLIMLVPFYGAGSWLFNEQRWPLTREDFIGLVQNDFWGNMANLWDSTLYAVFAWSIISPFLILLLYGFLKPAIRTLTSSRTS